MPEMYVERTLEFVSKQISASHHIEFYLSWATKILTIHASKENLFRQQSLVLIQDSLQRKYDALSKVCDFNKYTLKVLKEMGEARNSVLDQQTNENSNSDEDDDDDEDGKFDENALMLMKKDTNGHGNDVEMESEDSSDDDDASMNNDI